MAKQLGHVRYDEARGRVDYESIGPLSKSDVYYLDIRTDDKKRRKILTNWYGFHGGVYAWGEYMKWKRRSA